MTCQSFLAYHVDYIISKSIGRLKMLSKTRPVVSMETSIMLYKTICAPVFDYCDIIYDCLSQKNSNRLQKLQNSALHIISQTSRDTSVTELHAQFKLDTLVNRRHKHCCHYVYKGVNDMCPPSFVSMFNPVNSRDCSIAMRSATNHDVIIPNTRLEFTRKGYGYRGPFFWNLLDREIKCSTSFNQFKRTLNESDMFSWLKELFLCHRVLISVHCIKLTSLANTPNRISFLTDPALPILCISPVLLWFQ